MQHLNQATSISLSLVNSALGDLPSGRKRMEICKHGKALPAAFGGAIVRDAEDCLAATLDSVRNLADEIVVIDTGSLDSTIRIRGRRRRPS